MATKPNIEWIDDAMAEDAITNAPATFRIIRINPKDIDLENSIKRNSRPTRLIDYEHVYNLGVRMLSPKAKFKRPVAYVQADGRLALAGGNHRTKAAVDAGVEEMEVYLIESDDVSVLDTIRSSLNCFEGIGTSKEDSLSQAKRLIEEHGISETHAAERMGVKKEELKKYISASKIADILEAKGVPANSLSPTHLLILKQLADNHNVLTAVSRVVVRNKFKTEIVGELVAAVRKETGGEANQIAIAENYDVTARETGAKGMKREHSRLPTATRLKKHVGALSTFLKGIKPKHLHDLQLSPDTAKPVIEDLRDIVLLFNRLLAQPKKELSAAAVVGLKRPVGRPKGSKTKVKAAPAKKKSSSAGKQGRTGAGHAANLPRYKGTSR